MFKHAYCVEALFLLEGLLHIPALNSVQSMDGLFFFASQADTHWLFRSTLVNKNIVAAERILRTPASITRFSLCLRSRDALWRASENSNMFDIT